MIRKLEEDLGDDTGLSGEDLTECQQCGECSFIEDLKPVMVARPDSDKIEEEFWCDTCIKHRAKELEELEELIELMK